MIDIVSIKMFYPMLFIVITILIVCVCSVLKSRNSNMTFKDMFSKSSDNAKSVTIDTTTKMANMHNKVIPLQYSSIQEHELHYLECSVDELDRNLKSLKSTVDDLVNRVMVLEKK